MLSQKAEFQNSVWSAVPDWIDWQFNSEEILMAQLLEYKCPCCGGTISFDSNLQKMKCPYCDTEFDVESLKDYGENLRVDAEDEMEWSSYDKSSWSDGEDDGICTYICNSCGGEIVGDENLVATQCPFCGNNVVIKGKLSGELKPDVIIPFKLDKKEAKNLLNKHLKGKKLLPKVFKDENHIDEIKGIYVPFWIFDATADATIRYKATKVRVWSDSKYDYTQTSYYSVVRGGKVGFEKIPVDGSTKMADELMESIEPFDFSEAVDFQSAYLAGYMADKYDVDSENSKSRANGRIKKSTEKVFEKTVVGYATCTCENSSIKLHNGKVLYALYPVWILNTSWKDRKYTFAMNGQTGKFVGDLPLDKSVFVKWLFALTAIVGSVFFAALYLLHIL